MPEIQEILTDLVIESVKKYIDPMTKLELPTLSVQTAIKTAAEQIEEQQRGRVEKLLKEFHEFTVEVRQKGVVPEASLEGLEISVHQFQVKTALKELEAESE